MERPGRRSQISGAWARFDCAISRRLAYCLRLLQDRVAKWAATAPFVTLGKASLEVFCAHLLFCFAALALVGDGAGLTTMPQVAIIACSLLGLYLVAAVSVRRQARLVR